MQNTTYKLLEPFDIVRPYVFVSHEPASLESLQGSKAWMLLEKVNRRENLTRDEKNMLFGGIKQGGWSFPFQRVEKRFLYKSYGTWYEQHAFDKTCLYYHIPRHTISEIHEIPNNC